MKKFAYILMGPDYNTELNKTEFKTEKFISYIRTVNNMDQAMEASKELKELGVGVIELCGAFKEEGADKIIEATQGEVGVGYVTRKPEQEDIFNKFFNE